jgi:phosphoglycerate kinase
MGDIYVNDAFGTAHRRHSSTYGVSMKLPNAIGFLIERELKMISGTIENPKRPLVAILGGAKVKDKIGIVRSLLDRANTIIIGGGMAFTFLKAKGLEIGKSICDNQQLDYCKEILELAEEKGVKILLPTDVVVADTISDAAGDYLKEINIPSEKMGVDIGKKTIKMFVKAIKKAKSIVWNGPMGVFENDAFNQGTLKVAKAVAKNRGTTIVGGGDSVAALVNMGLSKKITHISTGGGASLKLFEGKVLPAVDIIENKII